MSEKNRRKGWVRIPNYLLTELEGEALRAWLIIRSSSEGFRVTKRYLMSQMKLSDRTVRALLYTLREKGMLETTSMPQGNRRPCDIYRAVLPYEQTSQKAN